MNKTKIVVTVGPASQDYEVLKQMFLSGLDVIRINMSHADEAFCDDIIHKVNALNQEFHTHVALLMDLNGPTIVVDSLGGKEYVLAKEETIDIYYDHRIGNQQAISVSYEEIGKDLKYHSHLILGENEIVLKVIDKLDDHITCLVEKAGMLRENMKVISPIK